MRAVTNKANGCIRSISHDLTIGGREGEIGGIDGTEVCDILCKTSYICVLIDFSCSRGEWLDEHRVSRKKGSEGRKNGNDQEEDHEEGNVDVDEDLVADSGSRNEEKHNFVPWFGLLGFQWFVAVGTALLDLGGSDVSSFLSM